MTAIVTDGPDPKDYARLERRLATLESEREYSGQFAGFARCYPALAIVLAAVTFFPLYDRLVHKDTQMSWTFGSIWQILGQDNSGAGVMGLLLFGVLASLLVAETFAAQGSITRLAWSAGLAVVLMAMILLKPAMPDPPPDIGYGGEAALGVLALIVVCTVTHALMLFRHSRESAGSRSGSWR